MRIIELIREFLSTYVLMINIWIMRRELNILVATSTFLLELVAIRLLPVVLLCYVLGSLDSYGIEISDGRFGIWRTNNQWLLGATSVS